MERSRKLTLTNWTKANDALNLHFEGNKSKLTKHLNMSRTTVTAFFKEEPIREAEFRKICFALRLNWQEDSSVVADVEAPKEDSLEQIRSYCREKILQNYSKIRLLSGQEIGVDQLYVDVWLLDRPPHTFQILQMEKMLETFDLRNDRLGLGDRIKRNPGFEIANQESKLLILGKPGAGKTTFLKHLAIDWCNERFRSDFIAVFIEFRQIHNEDWQLLEALGQALNIPDKTQVKALLKGGQLLILMDGFDEVQTSALRLEVQRQLEKTVREYPKNCYVMTCRTQIIQGIPDGFTSVEVADFDSYQVNTFVYNWFRANCQNEVLVKEQQEKIELSISRNPALKELTVTPVLLGLMCLILQDEGEVPAQASLLYERGIRLLLRKWNDDKAINSWETGTKAYQELDVIQKENLLIKIAARKFKDPKNFVLFEQNDLLEQIAQDLQLPSWDEAKSVLKSIESQHGLLVERADELWSFSHLTFQEYFTTKWLLSLSSKELSQQIGDSRWQEVIQQLVKAQGRSDRLLRLIKQSIDYSIANDGKFQELLNWLSMKSQSIDVPYNLFSIRSFYFILASTNDYDLIRDLSRNPNLASDLDPRSSNMVSLDLILTRDFARDLDLDRSLNRTLALSLKRSHLNTCYNDLSAAYTLARDINSIFSCELECLKSQLLSVLSGSNMHQFENWCNASGQVWREELQRAMIKYRDIGHDWQFTSEQKVQLQHYYDTNNFLVDLLENENAASPEVRKEIEDTLLLPIAELKRMLPSQYGRTDA
jgi:predicted NACHT family NTPase